VDFQYDFSHQRALTFSTVSQGRLKAARLRYWIEGRYAALLAAARHSRNRIREASRSWAIGAGAAVAALLLVLKLGRLRRVLNEFRLARNPARAPQSAATLWYGRLLSVLAGRGWRKSPAQSPAAFLATIDDPGLRSAVAAFTTHYQRARFGASAPDAAQLPELFAKVKSNRVIG